MVGKFKQPRSLKQSMYCIHTQETGRDEHSLLLSIQISTLKIVPPAKDKSLPTGINIIEMQNNPPKACSKAHLPDDSTSRPSNN